MGSELESNSMVGSGRVHGAVSDNAERSASRHDRRGLRVCRRVVSPACFRLRLLAGGGGGRLRNFAAGREFRGCSNRNSVAI